MKKSLKTTVLSLALIPSLFSCSASHTEDTPFNRFYWYMTAYFGDTNYATSFGYLSHSMYAQNTRLEVTDTTVDVDFYMYDENREETLQVISETPSSSLYIVNGDECYSEITETCIAYTNYDTLLFHENTKRYSSKDEISDYEDYLSTYAYLSSAEDGYAFFF